MCLIERGISASFSIFRWGINPQKGYLNRETNDQPLDLGHTIFKPHMSLAARLPSGPQLLATGRAQLVLLGGDAAVCLERLES
jgi:hypothetical protein